MDDPTSVVRSDYESAGVGIMDVFGIASPEEMPTYFFMCGTDVSLDYKNARRADVDRQNFSVMPRVWYIDTNIVCKSCGTEFLFSVDEQETWYEKYRFYVDSFPNRCRSCRADRRRIARLREEYDETISEAKRRSSTDVELKRNILAVIDKLVEATGDIPARMLEHRNVLVAQIRRLESVEECDH